MLVIPARNHLGRQAMDELKSRTEILSKQLAHLGKHYLALPPAERVQWGSSVPGSTNQGPGVCGWICSLTNEEFQRLFQTEPEPVQLFGRMDEPVDPEKRASYAILDEHKRRAAQATADYLESRR